MLYKGNIQWRSVYRILRRNQQYGIITLTDVDLLPNRVVICSETCGLRLSQRPIKSGLIWQGVSRTYVEKYMLIFLVKGYVLLGLCIIYFKRYDTYHDTHQAIFDMYQRYILSGFWPRKVDISTNSNDQNILNFNDQNILNLSKNVSFEVSCN